MEAPQESMLELDIDRPPPAQAKQGPAETSPFARAVRAIGAAPTRQALEAVVAQLRALPEDLKARLRPVLRAREATLRAMNQAKAEPAPAIAPTLPSKPAPTSLAGLQGAVNLMGAIDRAARPALESPIVHIPTGPSVFDLPRAQRVRQPIAVIPPVEPARTEITAANLVAGASAEATGVFVGWAGSNEVAIAAIRQALADAGAVVDWAPAPRSAHFHAAEALKALTTQGRVVRAERGGARQLPSLYTGLPRRYLACWTVLLPGHSAVGDKAGTTVMRVQLGTGGDLEIEALPGHEADKTYVLADFDRRVATEALPAGDVTKWLRDLLIRRCCAVRVGGMWYVPARWKVRAERICTEMARVFGADWVLPALPVATSQQLRAGLTRGFKGDVTLLLVELQEERERARANKRADIGGKGAANYLNRLRELNDRAKEYRALLGAECVADVATAIRDAIAVLEPLCDDTAQRFAAMDMGAP